MSGKIALRQKIARNLSIIFEPVFNDEDDTLAYFCPMEGFEAAGTLVFKMDLWCRYHYDKYKELKNLFSKHRIPFLPFEKFVWLALARTFDHEVIHSVALLECGEDELANTINKIFTERLLDEIIRNVTELLKSRLSRVKRDELLSTFKRGVESMLRQSIKKRRKS